MATTHEQPEVSQRGKTTKLQLSRWLRALAIAKILFEEEWYHTVYLEEIEAYIKEQEMNGLPVYRVSLVRESTLPYADVPQMRDSKCVARLLQECLKDTDREHFVVFFLDQKNRLTGLHTVSMGSLTASVVHPRETYKAAILANAAAIVAGHNHPSGDVQPSREDRALTTRLYQAGKLLGIMLLDHVIIGSEGQHFSFADEGLLDSSTGDWGG